MRHQITGGEHTGIGGDGGGGSGRFTAQADAFQVGPGEKPRFGQGQPAEHRPAHDQGFFSPANSKALLPVSGQTIDRGEHGHHRQGQAVVVHQGAVTGGG
ncbi:hypothetical protein RS9916_35762 [Synechococcus sp. RS9916]|nr:hypothetical protein RS9916_35762 [Synechococcus sp. RS9916]